MLDRITSSRFIANLVTNRRYLLSPVAAKKTIPATRSAGFTIVELLIVIIVIGILAAIIIIAYNGVTARARDAKRASDLGAVSKALELYHVDNGGYPLCTGAAGSTYPPGSSLQADILTNCVTNKLIPKYMTSIPTDPVNSGSKRYWYAVGCKKTGAVALSCDLSDNYILGDKQDAVTSPVYSGWGLSDLTLLLGSNN